MNGILEENSKPITKNFHLPSWFSFQDIFKLSNLEKGNHKVKSGSSNAFQIKKDNKISSTHSSTLDNYEKLILKEHKLPKDVKDELELVFEHFQDEKGDVNINYLKKELKSLNFHKENPKVYRIIDELCFLLDQNDQETVSFVKFIEFLEKKLLDYNSRKSLSDHYLRILNEVKEADTEVDVSDNFNSNKKEGINSGDLLKNFHSQNINDIDLITLKKIMKEIFGIANASNKDNTSNEESWDFELSNEDFYYIMTKRPEMVEAYFGINHKNK